MTVKSNKRAFPISVMIFLWNVITGLRTAFFNLLFLAIVLVILIAVIAPDHEPIPDKSPLLVAPTGFLVDQYTYLAPEDRLLNPTAEAPQEILVRDLIRVIDFASNDSRITGLLLDLEHFQGGGMSKLQEVGAAIDRFKDTGKPVVAIADSYDQQQYFLASYASEIYLNKMGNLAITGFSLYRNYFKQAMDKLKVEFHVFKVGQYKDFVEPYIRDDMSTASRQHNSQWLNELWQVYAQQVEVRRDLTEGALTNWINRMADDLEKAKGDTAQMALDMHLVDHLVTRVERRAKLIAQFGHKPDKNDELQFVPYSQYSERVLKNNPMKQGEIALIVAKGTILDGNQPEGSIGGDSLSSIIRKVRDDSAVKALVLRIDSGGGSAFASEVIRQELQAVRDQGIPVVVSMGSVAASGGYWIAMAADEIWATPTTITGSIGVFGLFPTVEKSLASLGVSTDGISTTNLAGTLRIDRPLSSDSANILQLGVEHIYDEFINLVATNRKSKPEIINEIAQGRVWTGKTALQLGLVDQLGGLSDAITSAATRAGLNTYSVKEFARELSPKEAFIKQLMEAGAVPPSLNAALANWSGMDLSALSTLFHVANAAQKGDYNAPNSTYALCVACFAP